MTGQSFPARSFWHLVVATDFYPASIHIFPDTDHGPKVTYPHQEAVSGATSKFPWNAGHPCLSEPTDAWGEHYGSGNEPIDLADRLVWHVERFAGWCLRAATGSLHQVGEHFELPPLPGQSVSTVIGFHESEQNFTSWQSSAYQSGVATLIEVSAPKRGLAVQGWQTSNGKLISSPPWGDFIGTASETGTPCLWYMLKSLPVLEAWQLPRTYRELREVLHRENIDLEETFAILGRSIRRASVNGSATLMLGFPVPKKFGEIAKRIHWLAIQNIPLSKKNGVRNGFRGTENNRQRFDRELARSPRRLDWAKCENWAPDQIRTRLRSQLDVRPSILLLGAGALGSHVAETLSRMGVVEIGIQDSDVLIAGNLCRHSLELSAIGEVKATALARRLNRLQPDVRARAVNRKFPELGTNGIEVPDYDVILDCTGSNSVLRGLAAMPCRTEKLFISLSVNWGAQGLLVWSSRGAAFPAIDAIERLGALAENSRPEKLDERIEGIGCWHPVFPADAADIQIWAGIGARFVLEMASVGQERCGIYHFNDDGTIGYRHG